MNRSNIIIVVSGVALSCVVHGYEAEKNGHSDWFHDLFRVRCHVSCVESSLILRAGLDLTAESDAAAIQTSTIRVVSDTVRPASQGGTPKPMLERVFGSSAQCRMHSGYLCSAVLAASCLHGSARVVVLAYSCSHKSRRVKESEVQGWSEQQEIGYLSLLKCCDTRS
eukprot:2004048-Amphidinium_carterae.2